MLETALFGRGRDHQFQNILSGQRDDSRVSVFDYSFLEGGGRRAYRYAQRVATFSRSGAYLPCFELRPADTLHKGWNALAHKNIRFDSHPEFSRRYVLKGALEDKVRALFTPGLLSFLDTLNVDGKRHIEGTPRYACHIAAEEEGAPDRNSAIPGRNILRCPRILEFSEPLNVNRPNPLRLLC